MNRKGKHPELVALLKQADQGIDEVIRIMKVSKQTSEIVIDVTDQVTRPMFKLIIVEHYFKRPHDDLREAMVAMFSASTTELLRRVFVSSKTDSAIEYAQGMVNQLSEVISNEIANRFEKPSAILKAN